MNGRPMGRFAGLAVVIAVALIASFASAVAAQKSDAGAAKAKQTQGSRLPAYYAKVSTEEQQTKLRAIVKDYAPKIKEKRTELQALLDKRDAELDKVLTPGQREELAKLKAAAQQESGSGAVDNDNSTKKAKSKAKKAA